MTPASFYIPFLRSRIHYLQWGNGSEWLFCFHGYGESAGSFGFLAEPLGKQFTIIAIDMPFHGATEWKEGLLMQPDQLVTIMQTIKPPGAGMHLFGYSMGGRISLQLLLQVPEEIRKLVLVAPDGLHHNPWQKIATRTWAGNRLFAWLMKHPAPMLWPLNLAASMGLYDKNLLRFIHYYLNDAGQRALLYRRWTTLRKFRPEENRLVSVINRYHIPVDLLFGRYDRVILTKHGQHFGEKAGPLVRVTEIEAGHQLIKEKHHRLISELLVQ